MAVPAMRAPQPQRGEYVVGLDMQRYLNYVASTQPLKTAPAFDTKGVLGQLASAENEEFGGKDGSSVNFTVFSAFKNGTDLSKEVIDNVYLMNPMNFIGIDGKENKNSKDKNSHKVAPHWYIRHGARDRDTGFPVPLNLALKLNEAGCDVNFLFAWNRPHSGDYALDELFAWLRGIM